MSSNITTLSWFSWIIIIVLLIIICLLALLYHAGLFKKVIVTTGVPKLGKTYIAYKYFKDEYQNTGKAINEIYTIHPTSKCFGMYFDDPKIIEKGKQRYVIAVILGDFTLEIDGKLEKKFLKHDYKTFWLPEIDNAVLCDFPLLNYAVMFSILLSLFKVYPVLERFIKKNKLCAHPFIELYLNNKIEYIIPLSQQSKFYVDEFHEDEINDEYYQKRKLIRSNSNSSNNSNRNSNKRSSNSSKIY